MAKNITNQKHAVDSVGFADKYARNEIIDDEDVAHRSTVGVLPSPWSISETRLGRRWHLSTKYVSR